jgi:hypothetical protein
MLVVVCGGNPRAVRQVSPKSEKVDWAGAHLNFAQKLKEEAHCFGCGKKAFVKKMGSKK